MDIEKIEELKNVNCCGYHTLVALEAYHYIKNLEKENQELREELEKSQSYEDPVLRGLDEFREMHTPENWIKRMADRDRIMGIPLEGEK